MTSDLEAVKRIVEAFERSDWQEIDVRWGDRRVHLVSTGAQSAPPTTAVAPPAPEGADDPVPTATGEAGATGATTDESSSLPPGAHVVTSPSPGIFWRAPEPGAPPFTEVGHPVEPAATVCIVEVMKLMNHVKAGVVGRVVAIYPQNGAAVAKDEPLVAVAVARGATP